jgi:antiviral helicase SKI2
VLRANIANLKFAVSDQNLELIPDYEQRIEVLQDLKFIDENSTVLLKGRVACEVRRIACKCFTLFIDIRSIQRMS